MQNVNLPESVLTKLQHAKLSSTFELNKDDCEQLASEQWNEIFRLLDEITDLNIHIKDRDDLLYIPTSLKELKQVKNITLSNCKKLEAIESLPKKLINLTIEDCDRLVRLPNEFPEELINFSIKNCSRLHFSNLNFSDRRPQRITVDNCHFINELLSNLPQELEQLIVKNCENLHEIPNNLPNSISYLELIGCNGLTKLPENLPEELSWLKIINCDNFVELPEKIPEMLQDLEITRCKEFVGIKQKLPDILHHIALKYCPKITELPIEWPERLNYLSLEGCTGLQKIETNFPFQFTTLDLSYCSELKSINKVNRRLCNFYAIGCEKLRKLPHNMQYRYKAKDGVQLPENDREKLDPAHFQLVKPENFTNEIREIDITGCKNLELSTYKISQLMPLLKVFKAENSGFIDGVAIPLAMAGLLKPPNNSASEVVKIETKDPLNLPSDQHSNEKKERRSSRSSKSPRRK